MRKILTIDIGGTFIKYAVVSGVRSFKVNAKEKIPTPKKDHAELMAKLAAIFNASEDVEGIAISMPGIIDTDRGVCISSSALNFSNGHCIAEELQAMCGGVAVTIENDATCAAIAEVKSGSLSDVKDGFVLVFGTSVGGAFVHNREVLRGSHFCAGEVAFTLKSSISVVSDKNFYGNDMSAIAFQKICAKTLGMPPDEVTNEMIFELIEENDDDILDALYKYAHGIAVKIFNLQMLFDPERFALGGGISERQSFIDAVNDKIDELHGNAPEFMPRPEVVACKYHNDANLLGALYRFLKR